MSEDSETWWAPLNYCRSSFLTSIFSLLLSACFVWQLAAFAGPGALMVTNGVAALFSA